MPGKGKSSRPKRPAPAGRARPTKLPSGRYSVQVLLGTDDAGKRIRKRVSGDTPEAAKDARDALLARRKAGLLGPDPTADRETVAALLRSWLENKDGTVAFSTWERYQLAVERHLVPTLGKVKIGALTPNDIRRAYRRLLAAKPEGFGLSARSVHYAHITLRQALAEAVQDGALVRNATEAVSPPSVPPREARALTTEEAGRLLAQAEGDWATLWLLALRTGMREGELLGLTWPDVDLTKGTVTIRRALVKGPANTYIVRPAPKSRAGVRIIPITASVVQALKQHRRDQNKERLHAGPAWENTDERVFLTRVGTAPLPSNVSRILKRDAERAGIPGVVGVHTLRHTFATSLLAAGRPVTEVSYLLGHASSAITLAVYAHHVKGADTMSAEALERYYVEGSDVLSGVSPHVESSRDSTAP